MESRERFMPAQCEKCKRQCPDDKIIFIPGVEKHICQICAGIYFYRCPECCNFCDKGDVFEVCGSSERVCIWCISEKYFLCPQCRQFCSAAEQIKYHGYYMCRSCLTARGKCCSQCGEINASLRKVPGGNQFLCQTCFDKECAVCPLCHNYYRKSDGREIYGVTHCPVCSVEFFSKRMKKTKTRRIAIQEEKCSRTPTKKLYQTPDIVDATDDDTEFSPVDVVTPGKMLAAYGLMSLLDGGSSGHRPSSAGSGFSFCSDCEDYCEESDCDSHLH